MTLTISSNGLMKTENTTKPLSKSEIEEMELRGKIYGARFDILHLEAIFEAREKGLRDPHFKLFKNWFGEVDLLQDKSINVTYYGAFYDFKVAMQSYGLSPSIDWDFTKTRDSKIDELKAGQIELDDLIGIYRNLVPISPLQGSTKMVLRMTMCGVKKVVFGQLTDGDRKTLEKRKNSMVVHLTSRPYTTEMVEELEKSTHNQKLELLANLAMEIGNLKKDIFALNEHKWPKIPCDSKVHTNNEDWVPNSHKVLPERKASRKPKSKNGKSKNGKPKRR